MLPIKDHLHRQNIASSFVLMANNELELSAVKTCLGDEAMALSSVSSASAPMPADYDTLLNDKFICIAINFKIDYKVGSKLRHSNITVFTLHFL